MTFRERIVQEAGQEIQSNTYTGPKHNLTFGEYYNRYSRSHVKLLKAEKPMLEEQQIDTFVHGIQCATTQTKLS